MSGAESDHSAGVLELGETVEPRKGLTVEFVEALRQAGARKELVAALERELATLKRKVPTSEGKPSGSHEKVAKP